MERYFLLPRAELHALSRKMLAIRNTQSIKLFFLAVFIIV
jgi:hypothetical protein